MTHGFADSLVFCRPHVFGVLGVFAGDRGAPELMKPDSRRSIAALAALAALAGLAAATAAAQPTLPAMIDAHAHYSAADAAVLPPAAMLARLDAAGVRRLVTTSSPPALAQALYRYAPDRVIPLLGVYRSDRSKTTWMRDPGLPAQLAAQLDSGVWAGIGELHLFAPDADQPVFRQLVRLAAARGLVLMIHGDAEVIERAFAIAPAVRVLWAHLGTEPEPEALAATLARHPETLWIDTSVRDPRIAPDGILLPGWRALFERFPERFVVAVDTFSINRWQHYDAVVAQIRSWTEPLPQPLRNNLLHDNAARLFESFLQLPPPR